MRSLYYTIALILMLALCVINHYRDNYLNVMQLLINVREMNSIQAEMIERLEQIQQSCTDKVDIFHLTSNNREVNHRILWR